MRRRFRTRRLQQLPLLIGMAAVLFIIICLIIFITSLFSEKRQAIQAADNFYQMEQKGDFSNSWELFHSVMQEKFNKNNYVQDRSHVFLEHFGVESFRYRLTEAEKIKNYQADDGVIHPTVYRLQAITMYESMYGYLEIMQPIVLAKEEGEWRVLWEYNDS